MLQVNEKIKDQTYEVSLKSTGIVVGEFIKVDGFYYYSENKNRTWGLWSQEFLESLTAELRIMNKELNDSIDEYFNFQ
jgi:hypothetical protein